MALHHAISYTVQHLGDLATRHDFWCINVPRTSHGVSAVRHALVALGAAHWSFLSRQSSALHSLREQQCLGLFLKHYNLAIRHLGPSMANAAPQDMRTILMCCLIFICVENMRGRYDEALRHLKAGLRLLISLRPTSRVATLRHWGVCGTDTRQDVTDDIPQDDELDSLALLFSRLALDTSVLTDGDVVSHLEMLGQPESIQFPVSSGSPMPFSTAAAARDELHRFEIFHDIYYERVFRKNAPNTDGPLEFDQEDKDIYRMLYHQYQWWRVCFDLYVETRRNSATPEEKDLIAKLRLNQLTWNALFKQDHWSLDLDPILVPGELEAIVEQAETIACSTSTRNHPVFTFDADIIPSLSYVGAFSDDPDLLRRLVKVLRKLKVREGPWDSDELAEIYEGVLVAREQYGQVISGYPGGLLSVAEALAALGLPCVKPTNSILRLSSSIKGYM
ncbi:hypothetical protein CDV36_003744 [Fusarium kuroshium]|uniref:Transcription factor domain-containing protein n=1 Tax=Fusarium kuroshium TaxID=2010991 RepID=A0A3M2SGD7_9HYPO|nr:hypothetical protein CDV36_003744 [Fusarium kuroshium]